LERPRCEGTSEILLGAHFELVVIDSGNQEAGVKLQQLATDCQQKLKEINLTWSCGESDLTLDEDIRPLKGYL
jgi:hypothetical protein